MLEWGAGSSTKWFSQVRAGRVRRLPAWAEQALTQRAVCAVHRQEWGRAVGRSDVLASHAETRLPAQENTTP